MRIGTGPGENGDVGKLLDDYRMPRTMTAKETRDYLGDDPGEIRDSVAAERLITGATPDVHQWLASPEPEYDWLVRGLLERQDRLIITGKEGDGKTTLLRQIAVTVAAGLHPFTQEEIEARRVLYIDLENSDRVNKRQFRPLVIQAKDRLEPNMLYPIIRTEGLRLVDGQNADWLRRQVTEIQPDLVMLGPVYKLVDDENEAQPAKAVIRLLDELRAEHNLAIILEAHSTHEESGKSMRPAGTRVWMRWAEFGYGIKSTGGLQSWRGPREERDWPNYLSTSRERPQKWPFIFDMCKTLFAPIDGVKHIMVQILNCTPSMKSGEWFKEAQKQTECSKSAFHNFRRNLLSTGAVDTINGEYFVTEKAKKALAELT